jgi:hypothetical protein
MSSRHRRLRKKDGFYTRTAAHQFFPRQGRSRRKATIKNCTAILTSIKKDGKTKWGGDTATLTFAQGEAPDRFSKTIRNEIPEFFDVLAVTTKGEMFPGTYDATYGRWWPYQPALREIDC